MRPFRNVRLARYRFEFSLNAACSVAVSTVLPSSDGCSGVRYSARVPAPASRPETWLACVVSSGPP